MSYELSTKIRLALEQLAAIREQFEPLVLMASETQAGVIETAAACAMLHSFYTETRRSFSSSAASWTRDYLPRIHGTRNSSFRLRSRPRDAQL